MIINKTEDGAKNTLELAGRLDTTTAPQLETEVNSIGEDVSELELNLKELDYLSSAGLRVVLSAQKKMAKQGKMIVTNVNESIMEVFEITGFADILTIV